jgi:hypothetical protein
MTWSSLVVGDDVASLVLYENRLEIGSWKQVGNRPLGCIWSLCQAHIHTHLELIHASLIMEYHVLLLKSYMFVGIARGSCPKLLNSKQQFNLLSICEIWRSTKLSLLETWFKSITFVDAWLPAFFHGHLQWYPLMPLGSWYILCCKY